MTTPDIDQSPDERVDQRARELAVRIDQLFAGMTTTRAEQVRGVLTDTASRIGHGHPGAAAALLAATLDDPAPVIRAALVECSESAAHDVRTLLESLSVSTRTRDLTAADVIGVVESIVNVYVERRRQVRQDQAAQQWSGAGSATWMAERKRQQGRT